MKPAKVKLWRRPPGPKTQITAKIIKHSRNMAGDEIITWLLTYPRFAHADLMTHRVLSRNGASSRAIPINQMLRAVIWDPAMPVTWGANGKGMQAHGELSGARRWLAKRIWLLARWPVVLFVWTLLKIGLHKQWANRMLEPWLWMTITMTATEHENFLDLRDSPLAQPELHVLCRQMRLLRAESLAIPLADGEWHIPFLSDEESESLSYAKMDLLCSLGDRKEVTKYQSLVTEMLKRSTARCARSSYIKQESVKKPEDDARLHDQLASDKHWSAFEHCAMADSKAGWVGNFHGFVQYRKFFQGESGSTKQRDQLATLDVEGVG